MQHGMLFHSLYEADVEADADRGAYLEQISCALVGQLNVKAFQKAWEMIQDRHEPLRTSFHWKGLEQPLQMVHNQPEAPWEHLDLRHLSGDTQVQELDRHLNSQEAFDLNQPPLMRFKLVRLDDDRYHFIWNHHHLLMDGWSTPRLFGEVFALYHTLSQGQEPQLPAVAPYGSYIQWL